jgi:hypothetical protein
MHVIIAGELSFVIRNAAQDAKIRATTIEMQEVKPTAERPGRSFGEILHKRRNTAYWNG